MRTLCIPLLLLVSVANARNRQKYCRVSEYGSDYTGDVSVTVGGHACQRWDAQEPHGHTWTDGQYFPDGAMDAVANGCRNPDAYVGGPWCYTTNPGVRWELCDVTACHDMPECKLSPAGMEYRGSEAHSVSGRPCLPSSDASNGEEDADDGAAAYCRNPDGREGGPWCVVGEAGEWEYCSVQYCKPSASCLGGVGGDDGADYVGTVAVTEHGRFCQRWDAQWPHAHTYTDPEMFPEDTVEGVESYCRNPSAEEPKPWCFTTNPDVRWQYCAIPQCPNCRTSDAGNDYAGMLASTASGRTCQRWDRQVPHVHNFTDPDRFPDASLAVAGNTCRNPDSRPGGPWCHTTAPGVEWQACDVPLCASAGCKEPTPKVRHPRLARHVLHIGVDGMDPCFVDAPGGAPNIRQRLGDLGTSTVNKGRNVMPAYSGPNWAAHLASMNVPSTGVLGNSWTPSWRGNFGRMTPVTGKNVAFPSVAGQLRGMDSSLRVAAFHGWDWLVHMFSSGMPGSLHKEMYCSVEVEGQDYRICDDYLIGNASAYLRDAWTAADSTYTFVYLSELDVVGHRARWCDEEYLAYVNTSDVQVGRLLDVVDDMALWDDVLVIVGTDHGGAQYSHGWDDDRDIPIPVYLRGPGVRVGHEFQHTVRNYDIGATAAYALGIPVNPWWDGKVMWEAFEKEGQAEGRTGL